MKKILITGGTTFVSRFTADHFVKNGDQVFVLNRNTKPQVPGVTLIEGDRHQLGDKLKGIHFDAVLDITAYDEADIIDLHEALDSFDDYIMISSSAVYTDKGTQPFTEDRDIAPNTYWGSYGTNKIEAENALTARVPDAYIFRPPYLYGPMNNLYREAFVFDCAKSDRKFYIPGDGTMKLQFFHVADLCGIMKAILETHPKEHIYNVGNEESVSIKEWARLCYACYGKEPEFVSVSEEIPQLSYISFVNYEYYLDISRQKSIYRDLIPLSQGLRESAEWYNSNENLVNKRNLINYIDENLI